MSNKPDISFVVPCYNTEKYLKKCLDSILAQSLKNIEIICVNDGSKDNTINILREYKEKYNNIIVIDKKNEGAWKARTDGIKMANGKYIAFVDSDDQISESFAEKLFNRAEENNFDILVVGFSRVDSKTGHVYSTEMNKFEGKVIDMDENPEDILSINTALWNKLYKADVLKKIKEFENPPKILEDMMFLMLAYLNCKKIGFINESLYLYMVRNDSVTSTTNKSESQIKPTEEAMIRIKDIYKSSKTGKNMLEVVDCMAFLHFGIALMLRQSDNPDFSTILKENEEFLYKYFGTWRTTKYLKFSYTNKHKSNKKIALMKFVYEKHLYKAFLKMYKWVLKTFKIDIKW